MIVCVIPARGGSKGIAFKNIVPVSGKPLIAWTLEQAADSQVDEIVVSTDCDKIARVCAHYGVTVFHRSPETATDEATSESAVREVLQKYSQAELCVFLQSTSPMRADGDIDACIDKLRGGNFDSVFSVRRVDGYLWRTWEGKSPIPIHNQRKPRQLNPITQYEENGSIYVFRPAVLERYHMRMGGRIGVHEMHPLDSFQIDEPKDVPLIESLMRERGYVGHESAASI